MEVLCSSAYVNLPVHFVFICVHVYSYIYVYMCVCVYRVSLSLEAPNYCLCIQSNSAGFSFVNTGKQVHLKHARWHFEWNLVKDVHHRSVDSRNWLKSYGQGEADLTPANFFLWGLLKGKVYKNTPCTIEQLKDAIHQEIQAVNVDTLGKTHSSVLGCERRPVSASIMSRSCFASFLVCVYKFSSHYLNTIIFYRQ